MEVRPAESAPEDSPALERLRQRWGGALLETVRFRGEETAIVDGAAILEVCRFLKEDAACQFDMLTDVCGVHFLDRDYAFEVVYHLYSFRFNRRLRLKVRLGAQGRVPSVTSLWPTADWHEREVYDMVGVGFDGHPDLRRILMPEDYDRHPLRRDFDLYES